MQIIDINGNKRECESVTPDPDFPGYLKVAFKNERRSYFEWYSINEFATKNPELASTIIKTPPPQAEDLGRVSKSTNTTLTDITKSWKKDIFAGLPVWISRGTGEGQVRTVKSNTKNKVFVDKNWDTLPDKTSQYLISPNVHNPHALGNTLPELTTKKRKTRMN